METPTAPARRNQSGRKKPIGVAEAHGRWCMACCGIMWGCILGHIWGYQALTVNYRWLWWRMKVSYWKVIVPAILLQTGELIHFLFRSLAEAQEWSGIPQGLRTEPSNVVFFRNIPFKTGVTSWWSACDGEHISSTWLTSTSWSPHHWQRILPIYESVSLRSRCGSQYLSSIVVQCRHRHNKREAERFPPGGSLRADQDAPPYHLVKTF